MKPWAKKFYLSQAWRNCSKAYARSVGELCERCAKVGKITPYRVVHHKIHLTPDNINVPEISMNWNNLEALCDDCHAAVHSGSKRYKVDSLGRVTSIED